MFFNKTTNKDNQKNQDNYINTADNFLSKLTPVFVATEPKHIDVFSYKKQKVLAQVMWIIVN